MKSELSAAALRSVFKYRRLVLGERYTHHQVIRAYAVDENGALKSRAFCCTLYVIGKVIFDG